jgi:polyphosphate kinase
MRFPHSKMPAPWLDTRRVAAIRAMTLQAPKRTHPQAPAPAGELRRNLLSQELSFLDYDARVLELAADPAVPLLERVKFCAIFSSMLDEFFMVRVAGLRDQAAAGVDIRSPDGQTPRAALGSARERVLELTTLRSQLWTNDLVPALAAEGIVLSGVDELDAAERKALRRQWERDVYPVLTPLAVSPGQPFPYISALSVSLLLFVCDPKTGEERLARVKVPEGLPRFVPIGHGGRLVPLEDIVAHFLGELFPGMETDEPSLFRVTRDADLDVSDEADDLIEAVEVELRRARFGEPTRLEVSTSMPKWIRARLEDGLRVDADFVYPVAGTLDLADAMELTRLDRPDLNDEHWVPVARRPLAGGDAESQFTAIRARDRLVHHPYDSFAASFESFLHNAACDPEVIAIKSTIYRTSDDTPLVPELIDASARGKQTVCLVEIKARGDERRNIGWSRALEEAGVHVAYGFPALKIHAKATLVVRREPGGLRRYAHLGTGNYNTATAGIYEDYSLFTADEDITADLADLFNYLTGFGRPAHFRKLLVAPFQLKTRLLEEIRRVAEAARAGEKARITIKVNGLTHPEVIDELYAASAAGARIDLVVRGVCSLRPGVAGISENIRVRAVLGRFLEHSRVYRFDANGRSTLFLGSADLMPRNLDHRVEVLVPIEDTNSRAEVDAALETLLADTSAAWELQPTGTWDRIGPKGNERPRSAQARLMRRARRRAAAAAPR